MDQSPVILIIIGAIVLLLLVGLYIYSKKAGKRTTPNFRVFFILGITWLPLGIATDNPAFYVLGIVFMIIGLANKDKWGQETKWSDLSPETKRLKLIVATVITVVFVALILAFLLLK